MHDNWHKHSDRQVFVDKGNETISALALRRLKAVFGEIPWYLVKEMGLTMNLFFLNQRFSSFFFVNRISWFVYLFGSSFPLISSWILAAERNRFPWSTQHTNVPSPPDARTCVFICQPYNIKVHHHHRNMCFYISLIISSFTIIAITGRLIATQTHHKASASQPTAHASTATPPSQRAKEQQIASVGGSRLDLGEVSPGLPPGQPIICPHMLS